MSRKRRLGLLLVMAAATGAAIAALLELQRRQERASQAADAIRSELDQLDPATRAMVKAQLARDAVEDLRADD